MSLFRSGKGKGDAPEERDGGGGVALGGSSSVEHAVDSLAAIVRIWGANAIEVPDRSRDEVKGFCEDWARHVLLATEPPETTTPLADGQTRLPEDARVIRPGDLVSQDYDTKRMNVFVTEGGKITKINCG